MPKEKENSPQLIAALESGVSAVLETVYQRTNKIKVNIDIPPCGTTWKRENVFYEKQLQSALNQIDFDSLSEDHKALAAIGWLNAWGIPEPKEVTKYSENVRNKARRGEQLTEKERLFLNVSSIDVDYF